jgi:hypothetical protein
MIQPAGVAQIYINGGIGGRRVTAVNYTIAPHLFFGIKILNVKFRKKKIEYIVCMGKVKTYLVVSNHAITKNLTSIIFIINLAVAA